MKTNKTIVNGDKPVKLFPLDQLIKIGRHHLKDNAGVAPEHEAAFHVDNVPVPTQVLRQKMPENFHFVLSLLFVLCVIPHHLDGNVLLLLVVEGLQHLAKGALSQQTKYLVSESKRHLSICTVPVPLFKCTCGLFVLTSVLLAYL